MAELGQAGMVDVKKRFRAAGRLSALAGLWLLLCPHQALPAAEMPPAALSRTWCAYETQHFRLTTDLPQRRALARVRELGRFRQLFLALFPEAHDQAGLPLRMLIFRRAEDFTELVGTETFAGITVPSLRAYQLLIGPHGGHFGPDTGVHEYAHYLLRNQTNWNYPLWYEEGLASYLSAVRLNSRTARLGRLDPKLRQVPPHGFPISTAAVVTATDLQGWPQAKLTAFYERSWLLVHFIRLGHRSGYPDLRPRLAVYLTQPLPDFPAAFRLAPAAVEELVEQHRRRPLLPKEEVPLPAAEAGTLERRCLTAAESRLELAAGIVNVNRRLAAALLAEAEDGNDAERLTVLSMALTDINGRRAATAVERALRLAPNHPGAIVQQARLRVRGCALSSAPACMANWAQAVDLYRRAWLGSPERYDAAYGLGLAYLHTGRTEEALPHLRLAHEKMPSAAQTNYYLGEAYRRLGDERAAAHLQKARNWALEPTWKARAETALARLRGRY